MRSETTFNQRLRAIKRVAKREIKILNRLMGQKEIYCLGDSHIRMFAYLQKHHYLRKTSIHCRKVAGASAMGLANPNSKTNALRVFQDYLCKIPKQSTLVFMLGEVDCGFVIWYRAQKYTNPVETQFEQSLENYFQFVQNTEMQGYRNIVLASAPLPTILDGQDWGDIANARREVTATLIERTELTRRYNQRLRLFCDQNAMSFLDFEAETTNSATGLINDRFRHSNPLNHHFSSEAIAPILVQKLATLGFK